MVERMQLATRLVATEAAVAEGRMVVLESLELVLEGAELKMQEEQGALGYTTVARDLSIREDFQYLTEQVEEEVTTAAAEARLHNFI